MTKTKSHYTTYIGLRTEAMQAEFKRLEKGKSLTAPYFDGPYKEGAHLVTRCFQFCTALLKAESSIAAATLPVEAEDCIKVITKLTSVLLEELERMVRTALLLDGAQKNKDTDILFQVR